VAVLARMEKRPGESIAAPEGRESGPQAYSLQKARLLGTTMGP
jgi:hypothetical protein